LVETRRANRMLDLLANLFAQERLLRELSSLKH